MSKDLIATTNHICFIFLAQKSSRRSTRQTTVTYSHISVLENHLHVNYAPLRLLTRYGWSSQREIFLTKMQLNLPTACDPCISWHCFVIGSTTELLVVLQVSYGRRQNHGYTVFGFLSETLMFACPVKLRLELASHFANAYKVTWSDLGVGILRTIRPSPWSFVRFLVCPSQLPKSL